MRVDERHEQLRRGGAEIGPAGGDGIGEGDDREGEHGTHPVLVGHEGGEGEAGEEAEEEEGGWRGGGGGEEEDGGCGEDGAGYKLQGVDDHRLIQELILRMFYLKF